ncbi:MAG: zinc ribbon domain-containing protein [Chloroflexi bacterium]|nr:zinc ribbon domain-containing protein [Chloroflexota bacterium]
MRKFFLLLAVGVLFVFPSVVSAQDNVTLASVNVQLWPEYDQPSMLVITDFIVAENTQFPVSVTFRIPQDANLIAVAAYDVNGSLVNITDFEGPTADGEWRVFTINLTSSAARFEYYQPLSFNGEQRIFSYLWDGAYAVDTFNLRVLEPLDTTSLATTPELTSILQEGDLKYYTGEPVKLTAGQQFALNLDYKKSTDALITSSQAVQPAAPVDETTPGRVSLSNYLPYILGGLGVVMIVGGFAYYWQSGRGSSKKPRRRAHSNTEGGENEEDTYCPQCGTRAKPGDRFCRVCGGRIRHQEE